MEDSVWSRELNAAQLEAVQYCDGPSLVIAGAGSGKTRVLTYKIAYLMQERYVSPLQILALTFTNKAAREMNTRIAQIVGGDEVQQLWSGTFHSIFARLLRRECERIGFTSNFTIYDSSDSKSLIKHIIKELALDDKTYKASIVQNRISEAKNCLIFPAQYAADATAVKRDQVDNMPELARVYATYFDRCRRANAMDFDDLLLYTYQLLRDHADVQDRYKRRFRYILVDEYQDTNYAQHQIVRLLTDPDSSICVVGDDAQSIYAFRGARIDNILRFTEQYPTARTIKLERNYRSTQTIVNAANSIISHNTRQIPKTVYSENAQGQPISVLPCVSDREEAAKVVGEIRRLVRYEHLDYNDIAILYRVNALSRSLEDELRRHNLPYRIYGGQSFYQRKEIKDVIAYFRLLCNEHDEEAFRRVVNYPTRGIGATSLDKLQACARSHGASLWQVATEPAAYGFDAGRTMRKMQEFCALILSLRESMEQKSAYDVAVEVIQRSGIAADVHSDTDAEHLSKQENIDELLSSIRSLEEDTLEQTGQRHVALADYLSQVSLLTDADTKEDGDQQRVTLMTIHAAKGLEYNTVFLVGMEDEIFPGSQAMYPRQLEEERRLFYVAVTRAKERGYISFASSRFRNGSMEFSDRSRFLRDVDSCYLRMDAGMRTSSHSGASRISTSYAAMPQRRVQTPVAQPAQSAVAPSARTLTRVAAPARTATPAAVSSPFAVGQRVLHERFGQGTVHEIEGSGDNLRATVDFDSVGTKKLLLKFARLSCI